MNDPEKVSGTWVKHFYGLVDELNDTETEMIGMKSKDAIVLDEVPVVNREAYPLEDVLPEDGLYPYLLQPGEEYDDQRCRAMGRIWSMGNLQIERNHGKHWQLCDVLPLRSGSPGPVKWAQKSICIRRADVNS